MKEQYYSDVSIDNQSQFFLEKIRSSRSFHNSYLNPKKVALLVIDCQRFFFDDSSHAFIPSSAAILPRILKLQNYCLVKGIPVIHTQHINTKENSGMMSKWWGDHLPYAGDPLVEIIPEIASPKTDLIIKSQYDAFYGSELASFLESRNIKQLIITGVMTHLCCETTARVAFTRGYEVFFSIDGTATYNQEFHLSTLINLAHGFAIPLLVDEILNQLR